LSFAASEQHFDIEHFLALKGVSEISLSPDGQYIAYTMTANDLEADEIRSSVWMQATNGGDPLQMTSTDSNASGPKWSPDNRYLAVLSDRKDETSQVWLLDRRGGDAQPLTEFKQGIQAFDWAPDSKRLWLLASDPTPADLDEKERPHPRPYVIDRLQFKEDYVGYLDRHRTHVYVFDLANRTSRQVTSGDFDDSEPAWSPDGKQIVFVSNRSEDPDRNRNTDLWLVDASDTSGKLRQLTNTDVAEASPAWSPDGRTIIYTSTVAEALPIYAIPQLAVIDLATGQWAVNPSLLETQVIALRYTPDGRAILAITEYHGEQNLVRIDTETGAVAAIIDGSNIVTEFDVASDGSVYALVTQPQLPDEIFALRDATLTQLSFVNRPVLQGLALARVEKHRYESDDGTPIEMVVTFPAGNAKKKAQPGVLLIHGGPQAQYDYRFDYEAQMLAARGYVVVMPNPRGSYGYGQKFASAAIRDWGGIDYIDVMAGMDHAIAAGWVDENRMAVMGWSYGGILTNHVITKTNRFKAAITGASETLYAANYGHDQYQRWWEEELGLPWLAENRANYERISPFYALDKVTTPTLVVGGEDDWNVPIQNSEQLYIVLKRRGIPTELVVYPSQGHSLAVPSYNKDLYERYFAWLARYVTP
jgi:dipeptidyl aminopeptidase/acylaminoacyl peptidase